LEEEYDRRADIWSSGVILYMMVCGYPPFNGENDKEIADNILTREPEIP
jgi:calcium-dependent protein kinase